MLENLLSITSAALRSPYGKSGMSFGGVHQINPVVRSASDAIVGSTPSKVATDSGRTTYTPSVPANPQDKLYSRTGGFNTSGFQEVNYERSDTFDLSVKTVDGDIATISISQQQRFNSSVGSVSATGTEGQSKVVSFTSSSSDRLDFNLSVQGDLSAEETAAINALVSKVSDVADDFFAGYMEEATQAASQIGFGRNDGSLSGYSFSLQSQESLRAVAAYESLAASTPFGLSNGVEGNSAQRLSPRFAQEADSSTKTSEAKVDIFASLRAMLNSLARSAKELTA